LISPSAWGITNGTFLNISDRAKALHVKAIHVSYNTGQADISLSSWETGGPQYSGHLFVY
jgi:hypothetical protein